MPRGNFEAIESHRAEIEERTRNGESLVEITEALASKGYICSSKTLSRYRLSWGIRQRAPGRTTGYKYPNRKRKVAGPPGPNKQRNQEYTKAEITKRTAQGETAEQIAEALIAQGVVLKKGASTVWRLQTYWGLIPYDKSRARGVKARNLKRAAGEKVPPAKKVRRKEPPLPADPFVFYPGDCQHGPQKRGNATVAGGDPPNLIGIDSDVDAGSESDPEPLPIMDSEDEDPGPAAPSHRDTIVGDAAELMSAEFLVDLATSTLIAAKHVQALYKARKLQTSMPGSRNNQPPTDQDIANAKQKVREAAGVMYDLALPTAAAPV